MERQNLFLQSNIKHLRKRLKINQEELAIKLGFNSRSKIAHYEAGNVINPPLEELLAFSVFFKMAVDTLLKVDLSKLGELNIRDLEAGNDVYIAGKNIRVLAITVDTKNKENVEYVPIKAKAGYLSGYNDPQFISKLEKYSLPNLSPQKSYRIFETEGDSMLPIPENSAVIGTYVVDWNLLKATPCVVNMNSEQSLLFKVVTALHDKGSFLLHSLNHAYPDKTVLGSDIKEFWQYHSHITNQLNPSDSMIHHIFKTVNEIRQDVKRIAK